MSLLLIAVVVVALFFDFTNGFHDAANAIATSIGTRALSPNVALAMAATLNIVGGLIYETKVADTMSSIVDSGIASQELVLAALLGAILWNLFTWWFGIPSSSSHALIGGLVGAGFGASWSLGVIKWAAIMKKVIVPTVASPVAGLAVAALVSTVLYRLVHDREALPVKIGIWAFSFVMLASFFGFVGHVLIGTPLELLAHVELPWWAYGIAGAPFAIAVIRRVVGQGPWQVNGAFRILQTLSAGYMALEHGHNDAQKTMGIITLGLVAEGVIAADAGVPLWVKLACATVIGLGTFSGGKKIIKTMGMKLVKLDPLDGFAAETVAASVIQIAGRFGMPISTTHAITAAITGVGVTKRISAVKWGVTGQILTAWVLTLPAAAGVSCLCYVVIDALT
ncbi:MAG: inorganic phosphate transporter [Alphaproteobacteria bacterium]|nr:inorganic phosphate transporter [Alphaproteobacteria bacterium]MCB9698531.1 inorganic phosphate transporter [Alphaproteobacteria bacterium]